MILNTQEEVAAAVVVAAVVEAGVSAESDSDRAHCTGALHTWPQSQAARLLVGLFPSPLAAVALVGVWIPLNRPR